MKKNPEHKKFMADYDGLTDDKMKRLSGVENTSAQNSRKWFSKRAAKKAASSEINAVDGAFVSLRDYDKKIDEQTPIAADKIEKPISLEEAWEKSKSRGKKSK